MTAIPGCVTIIMVLIRVYKGATINLYFVIATVTHIREGEKATTGEDRLPRMDKGWGTITKKNMIKTEEQDIMVRKMGKKFIKA